MSTFEATKILQHLHLMKIRDYNPNPKVSRVAGQFEKIECIGHVGPLILC